MCGMRLLALGRCRNLLTLACSLSSREGYQRERKKHRGIKPSGEKGSESRIGSPGLSRGLPRRLCVAKVIVTVVTKFVARIVLKVIAKLSLFVVVLRSLWFFWGIFFVRLLIRSLWSPARG